MPRLSPIHIKGKRQNDGSRQLNMMDDSHLSLTKCYIIDYLFKSLFASSDRRQSRLTQVPARRKLRLSPSGTPACLALRLRLLLLNHVAGIICLHGCGEAEFSWKGICLQMSSSYFSWRSSCISAVQIFLERVGSEMPRAQLLCVVGVNCARRILASHFFNKSGRLIGKEWKECTLPLTSTPGLPLLWLHPNAAHCTMFCA